MGGLVFGSLCSYGLEVRVEFGLLCLVSRRVGAGQREEGVAISLAPVSSHGEGRRAKSMNSLRLVRGRLLDAVECVHPRHFQPAADMACMTRAAAERPLLRLSRSAASAIVSDARGPVRLQRNSAHRMLRVT